MQLIADKLTELRITRSELIHNLVDPNDPEVVNKMIADTISMLENLFFIINLPTDEFVPFTPKDDDGSQTSS